MPIARQHPPVEPIRHNPALDEFAGMWVAVDRDGTVRAAAPSSRDLAWEIKKRGLGGQVTARYVTRPADALRVGLG